MTSYYPRCCLLTLIASAFSLVGTAQAVVLDDSDWSFFPPFAGVSHYNGTGVSGNGNGDFGPGGGFPGGVYLYPFSDSDPLLDTPLLASIKDLSPVDQFSTTLLDRAEWTPFPTEIGTVAQFALKVSGTWYVNNALQVGDGETSLGAADENPAVQSLLASDLAAANWTVLLLGGDPGANTDTISLGGPAGAALSGTVEGYGLYRDIGTAGGLDVIGMTIFGVPEPTTILLLGVSCLALVPTRRIRKMLCMK